MNIKDIAQKAGVSPATVSRVLNDNSNVNKKTKAKVMAVIKESNYIPNAAARNLSMQNMPNNIGLFVPNVDMSFFITIIKGVTKAADKYRYNTFLFNTDRSIDKQQRFLQTVIDQNLKGIVMVPISEDDEKTRALLHNLDYNGIPVVLVHRKMNDISFDSVMSDDETDSTAAVKAFIKAGHKRIATVTGLPSSHSTKARRRGYEYALIENGIEINPEYIQAGDFEFEKSYEATERLLSLPEPPTAIFCAGGDAATLGSMRCMMKRGLTIGKDISIIGFDAIERWDQYSLQPELSLVERPVIQMAHEAVELLQSRIEGDSVSYKKSLVLSNRLVLRGSERMTEANY